MKKATYELALSIPEPSPQRFNSGGAPVKRYYTARIEGKKITRSSRWWSLWHHETEENPIGRCAVSLRVSLGRNEEIACLARKGESDSQYLARVGKTKDNLMDVKDTINNFLKSAWV